MDRITLTERYTVKHRYDVIVAGGGVAGVAAAVTAAKRGSSVLLLEKSNILGGLATLGQINLFVPMCNGRGKQIIFGLAEKWLRDSAKYGYDTIPDEWKNGEPKAPTSVRYIQRYSPYIFAFQLTEEIKSAGVDLLFDCIASTPVTDNGRVTGVITESKSGREYYACRILIDTTGDCDMLRRAGVPVTAGQNFNTYVGKILTLESCKKALEMGDVGYALSHYAAGSVNLFGDGQPKDIPMPTGLDCDGESEYLIRNQLEMLEKLKGSDRVTREIAMLPLMPQFRTTCHLNGDYEFTVGDAYRHFDDSVCAVNDFEHRDHLFEIPYRTLCRRDCPNILTAGRSVSASGYGWDIARVIPPAILTGEAAGNAASLALESGKNVGDIDVKILQNRLESENVMIHFPDFYVPEDKTVVIHGKNVSEIAGGHF